MILISIHFDFGGHYLLFSTHRMKKKKRMMPGYSYLIRHVWYVNQINKVRQMLAKTVITIIPFIGYGTDGFLYRPSETICLYVVIVTRHVLKSMFGLTS